MSHTEQMREALRKVRPYLEDGANHGDDAVELLKLVDEALTAPAEEVPEAMGQHWTEREPVRLKQSRAGRVYVAGPMTGLPGFNFPAFNAEAAALRAQGLSVLNPAEHGIVEGAEWADYLRHDIAGLASCERIHLLPGWTNSKGAQLEMHIAQTLGMDVTFADGAEQSTRLRGGVPEGWRIDREGDDVIVVQHQAIGLARATNPATSMMGQVLFALADDILQDRQSFTAAPQAPAAALDAGVVRDAERWRKFVSLDYKVRREWAANLSLTPVLTEWVDAMPAAQAGKGGA